MISFLNINIYYTMEITSFKTKFLMENFRCQLSSVTIVLQFFKTLLQKVSKKYSDNCLKWKPSKPLCFTDVGTEDQSSAHKLELKAAFSQQLCYSLPTATQIRRTDSVRKFMLIRDEVPLGKRSSLWNVLEFRAAVWHLGIACHHHVTHYQDSF